MASKKKNSKKNNLFKFFKYPFYLIFINRKYIYLAGYILLFFLAVGLIFPTPQFLQVQIQAMIQELSEKTANLNLIELIFFIFKNNLTVAFMGLILGVFFCLIPFILAASNGYVLGYVIKILIFKLGISNGFLSLWKLLPHGIFEIPAILISLGLGIRFGLLFISCLNKNSFRDLSYFFISLIKVFLVVILPLLLIAAFIEGSLIHLLG